MTTFTHREIAVKCFNAAWDLLDLEDRTAEEVDKMIHLSHTSFWHWTQVPEHTPQNISIGYWQLSRVYAVAGLGERALYYGERCLEVTLANETEIPPFYLGYAYEALCRVHALLGNNEMAKEQFGHALEYAKRVKIEKSKEMLLNDLHSIGIES